MSLCAHPASPVLQTSSIVKYDAMPDPPVPKNELIEFVDVVRDATRRSITRDSDGFVLVSPQTISTRFVTKREARTALPRLKKRRHCHIQVVTQSTQPTSEPSTPAAKRSVRIVTPFKHETSGKSQGEQATAELGQRALFLPIQDDYDEPHADKFALLHKPPRRRLQPKYVHDSSFQEAEARSWC